MIPRVRRRVIPVGKFAGRIMERHPAGNRAFAMMFAGVAAAVYAAAFAIARLLPILQRPDAVAAGMTIDMVVVVPLAFYLLVVRRRGWPVVTIAPVVVLGAVAAARVLPVDHQRPLRLLELLAVPLEIGAIGWIAWRAAGALRAARRDRAADPLELLRRAALDVVGQEWAAGILATESAVVYYGLGSWRARPHAPAEASAFPHHRRAGHVAIVGAFLLVMLVEGLAVHLLVSMWSALAAWALTIGTAYGAFWLIADGRATVLRPILVDGECVVLRAGLRWSLRVPRGQIAGVARRKPSLGKECLNLTLLGAPTHWVTFTRPVPAEGPYGLRRNVRAVGIQPDDAGRFDRVLGAGPGCPVDHTPG